MSVRLFLPAVALTIFTSGAAAQDTKVTLADLPPHARRNILSKIDASQISDVEKTRIGELRLYRVHFDLNGENHEMLVAPGGVILKTMAVSTTALDMNRLSPLQEDMTPVQFDALPQKAQEAVKEYVSAPHVTQIKEADLGRQTFYDVTLDEDSPYRKLRVTPGGEAVQKTLPAVAVINSWNSTVIEAAGAEKTRPVFETKKVFIEDLSPALQQSIRAQSGGEKVDRIIRTTVNGKTSYEVKSKKEFKLSEDGSVVDENRR